MHQVRRTITACLAVVLLPIAAQAAVIHGRYALIGGTCSVSSALTVEVARKPLQLNLDLVQSATGSGHVVRSYDVDATKKLHIIVVSDDFRTFMHIHPSLSSDGHFRYVLDVPRAGTYYLYADSTPKGYARQVFRFVLDAGAASHTAPVRSKPQRLADAGPYAVAAEPVELQAGSDDAMRVRITRAGRPATDLRAYLGNAAHVVFVDMNTLAYAHAHPEIGKTDTAANMPGMAMGAPELAENSHVPANWKLHAGTLPAGTYVVWSQFRGGSKIYVARFTRLVR